MNDIFSPYYKQSHSQINFKSSILPNQKIPTTLEDFFLFKILQEKNKLNNQINLPTQEDIKQAKKEAKKQEKIIYKNV
jgi:hypothetical protein